MSIADLIEAKAQELADASGMPVTGLHVHAAAHVLSAEIRRDGDMLAARYRPPGSEIIVPAPAPILVSAEPAPIGAGGDGGAAIAEGSAEAGVGAAS